MSTFRKDADVTSDGRYLLRRGALPAIPSEVMMDVVAATCDLAIVCSPDRVVMSVIASPNTTLGARASDWPGSKLEDVFASESWAKLKARLDDGSAEVGVVQALELNHTDIVTFPYPIKYSLTMLSSDGTFMMAGRDLRALAEVQQQLVHAQLALERDYEAQREVETRYRVVLEVNDSRVMIVSMSTGKIVDLNAAAAKLIGVARGDLLQTPMAQEFEGRRRGELLDNLVKISGDAEAEPVELIVRRTRQSVLVRPTLFRAAGDRLLLCRIDLTERAKAESDDLSDALARLYHGGVDAIVFMDADGKIKAANEAFLNLTDGSALASVVDRSFADFLSRGTIDLRVILDNAKRVGHLRHFATRLNTDYSGQVSVELSAIMLQDKGKGKATVALLIRDSTAAESMRLPGSLAGNEGLRNVMHLVGYSTLKDIVAETTEIIERMCIETALELTRNNRVAAAELLSLSRQSLYVKLRKFGLLSKEVD
jgi:transcriptional regulator PpsR